MEAARSAVNRLVREPNFGIQTDYKQVVEIVDLTHAVETQIDRLDEKLIDITNRQIRIGVRLKRSLERLQQRFLRFYVMAKKVHFSTVPDELLHIAIGAHAHFSMLGFRLIPEQSEIEYPRTPTLVGRRRHSTYLLRWRKIGRENACAWARYGRSCDSDVQVAFAIPNNPGAKQADMELCRKERIGIYTFDVAGEATEIVAPVDLALHVELPELRTFPPKVRAIVAPFYEKFERGDWRDGFADACLAIEDECRKNLRSRIGKPGVRILDKSGRPINLTIKQINRSTLGKLAGYYLAISTPNTLDSLLAKTLPTINPERIAAVHNRRLPATEKKLRKLAGRRMHSILNCLRELLKG